MYISNPKILINLVCGNSDRYFKLWLDGIKFAFSGYNYDIHLYCPPDFVVSPHENLKIIRDFGKPNISPDPTYPIPYHYWDRLIVNPDGYDIVHFSQIDWLPIRPFINSIEHACAGEVVVPNYPEYYYLIDNERITPRFWEGCCFIRSDILKLCNDYLSVSGHNDIMRIKHHRSNSAIDGVKVKLHNNVNVPVVDVIDGKYPWETLFETFLYLYLNKYKFTVHDDAIHLCGIEKPNMLQDVAPSDDLPKNCCTQQFTNVIIGSLLVDNTNHNWYRQFSIGPLASHKTAALNMITELMHAGWINSTKIIKTIKSIEPGYAIFK